MPPKGEIIITRAGSIVVASDGVVMRDVKFASEPEARRIELRLRNDRRFARMWLDLPPQQAAREPA